MEDEVKEVEEKEVKSVTVVVTSEEGVYLVNGLYLMRRKLRDERKNTSYQSVEIGNAMDKEIDKVRKISERICEKVEELVDIEER